MGRQSGKRSYVKVDPTCVLTFEGSGSNEQLFNGSEDPSTFPPNELYTDEEPIEEEERVRSGHKGLIRYLGNQHSWTIDNRREGILVQLTNGSCTIRRSGNDYNIIVMTKNGDVLVEFVVAFDWIRSNLTMDLPSNTMDYLDYGPFWWVSYFEPDNCDV